MKKKKGSKKIIIIVVTLLVLGLSIGEVFGYQYYQIKQKEEKELAIQEKKKKEEKRLLDTIKNNYSESVRIVKDTNLYKLEKDKYIEAGKIKKDVITSLVKKDNITIQDKYFKLANIDYYLFYEDIAPNDTEVKKMDTNYKNYVPFDKDLVTKVPTVFYSKEKEIYTINESIQLPIIIDDTNYYYAEYDGKLVGIKKDNIEKTIDVPRNVEVATQLGVLNYHFFFDKGAGESCNETICLETSKFEEQLSYLKENNFYTASMKDVSLWMSKKIRLPKKTAVITVDDGAMGTDTHLPRLLEKYDLHGTLFLITAWWSKDKYISPNLEIQSHGDDIHDFTTLPHPIYTKNKEQLVEDFRLSVEKLDGEKTAFCFPFYAYTPISFEALKEVGFEIAFIGGNIKATQNNNPYLIHRYVIYSNTTLNQFINMVN